jgi:hypothetical protein
VVNAFNPFSAKFKLGNGHLLLFNLIAEKPQMVSFDHHQMAGELFSLILSNIK